MLAFALGLLAMAFWTPAEAAAKDTAPSSHHATKTPERGGKKPRGHAKEAKACRRKRRKRARRGRLCRGSSRRKPAAKSQARAKEPRKGRAGISAGPQVSAGTSVEPPLAPAAPEPPSPEPVPAVSLPAPPGEVAPAETQPSVEEGREPVEDAKAPAEESKPPAEALPGVEEPLSEQPEGPTVGSKLRWALPQLHNPIVVPVTSSNETIKLEPDQDYIVRLPSTPLVGKGGLAIVGGHNVVVMGGEIDIPYLGPEPGPCCEYGRGLMLSKQTGTIHIEGLYIHGEDLNEGIDLQEPEAIVELENIRIEDVHARDPNPETGIPPDTHPDLIQSWSGPKQLLIDGLTGSTDYQGIFLSPNQYVEAEPEFMSMRNVDITGLEHSAYLLWRDKRPWPMYIENVWVSPRVGRGGWATMWPDVEAWSKVALGVPPGGSFIPMGTVGAQYRSPGYE